MRRFSAPVCSSSTAAYWPVRLIRRRTAARSPTTSPPATRAVPASGAVSVERMRTVVVLPAPLGPSRANTVPARDPQVDPVHDRRRVVRLLQAGGLDGQVIGHRLSFADEIAYDVRNSA